MNNALLSLALLTTPALVSAQTAGVASAGYVYPTRIKVAPLQVVTFFVHGIAVNLKERVVAASLPLPTSLAGVSAVFVQNLPGIPIPILSVEPVPTCLDMSQPGCSAYTAITVQIPSQIDVYTVTTIRGAPVAATWVRFSENGKAVATVDVEPWADQIHVLTGCDALFGGGIIGTCSGQPRVAYGSSFPAKRGDEIAIYAVGLGTASAPVGDTVTSPVPVNITGISFDARPNALPSRPPANAVLSQPIFAGFVPGYVGLYQINVIVPDPGPDIPRCDRDFRGPRVNSNLTINIIGTNSFDGAAICVQPSSQ